jgi:GNAT superfamily N-acetyltransferase
VLYGLDISVHPRHRGKGLARALYEARFHLVRSLGLARYATACRIPDYHLHSSVLSPESYAELVEKGALIDRTLTPLLRLGLRLVGVCREHMEDWESRNAAALLEWTP